MAIVRTLTTTPKIGLEVPAMTAFGDLDVVRLFLAGNDGNFPANSTDYIQVAEAPAIMTANEATQLLAVLHYCGRTDFQTENDVRAWLRVKTREEVISTIHKYIVEVFFPKLIALVNKYITGSGTASGNTGSFGSTGEIWEYVLKNMNVTYGADGKITGITL